jgi:translation initiation factor 1
VKHSKTTDSEYVLVYSTDPQPAKKQSPFTAKEEPYALNPAVRLERKGRGGKSVTVLYKLPPHQSLLKDLAAYLKKTLGSGGTSHIKGNEGFVEIQGDHQSSIIELTRSFKWRNSAHSR